MKYATGQAGDESDLLFASELPKHSNRWTKDKMKETGVVKFHRQMRILKKAT